MRSVPSRGSGRVSAAYHILSGAEVGTETRWRGTSVVVMHDLEAYVGRFIEENTGSVEDQSHSTCSRCASTGLSPSLERANEGNQLATGAPKQRCRGRMLGGAIE